MCVDFLYKLVSNISQSKKNSTRYTINLNGYSRQVHIILSDVNQISIFDRLSKILRRRI